MPEHRANLYRPPVAAAARTLTGDSLRPVSIAGRALTALVVAAESLTVAVLVRHGARIRWHALHTSPCSVIVERRQTRIELSLGEDFVLAGTLPHGRARRGLPLELGQHPMALTARALGMAGTPRLTVRWSALQHVHRARAAQAEHVR